MELKDNLNKVLEEIEQARRHSVTGQEVRLIAVTKTHEAEIIKEITNLGIKDVGENKVQELKDKIGKLGNIVNYHMIGNLQTNKVKYIYNKVEMIQSLDRIKLAEEIEKRAEADNICVNCLVQINIGDEDTKSGIEYCKTLSFIYDLLDFKHISIRGLMAIAPNTSDEKYLRSLFRKMFKMKEKISNENFEGLSMDYLSMGMSSDFKLAIEEGSNMVRIGSKIFGKRIY
ncbi:YggS family pyridoxal phosphate-dependent enzyme [Peptoniphilus raoultii]|uniref:YggS family pyridoxal phosphate-dependent enzyme n=1 Tax=Peptoniphilus raoultii TaxID=1776387 RepID=UPI0008DB231A|nr:YggS family pyridoxal phosphate-dependent enzyme [Peptoniphilus raoultii]